MEKEKSTYQLPEGWVSVNLEEISVKPDRTNRNRDDVKTRIK
jgi:hypothetical protein